MILTGETRRSRRKTRQNATLSTTNSTWTGGRETGPPPEPWHDQYFPNFCACFMPLNYCSCLNICSKKRRQFCLRFHCYPPDKLKRPLVGTHTQTLN
jgi:hypothetical protein